MKLNIRKKMITLALATTLVLNKSNVCGESFSFNDNDSYNPEIKNEEIITPMVSDYMLTNSAISIKAEANHNSETLANIEENQVVYRILSCDNNWYLVKYDNKIGYVHGNNLIDLNVFDDIDYYPVNDIIETTSKVNFRLGPSVDEKRITTINKKVKLETIAKASNNWYLVKYNDKIGYVYGDYITSLLDTINSLYPAEGLTEINTRKIVYVNASSLNVRNGPSIDNQKIGFLTKYESVKVLKEYDEWYFVINNDGLIGYINKSFTKDIDELYVVIDLSEQKLWLYDGSELLIETDIVTGMLDTPTRSGLFKIYSKQTDRYLTGEDYNAHVNYWMPFDGGIGLHDASWRKKFGGDIYLTDGSHGCVNMPKNITDDIYEMVSIGTKVLVHK